jgi:hypothetical protein
MLKKINTVIIYLALISFTVVFSVKENTGNNVCKISNLALANGTQNPNGECVETFMGEIPNANNMISTVILFPKDNNVIEESQPFTIRTKTINLRTGFFTDPETQYYIFPQTLDDKGIIQGHSHVVIQEVKNEDEPLDPKVFSFFKGLDDPSNEQGELNTLVDNGLPAGKYRICTLVSSFSHQIALMPVAQRGNLNKLIVIKIKNTHVI